MKKIQEELEKGRTISQYPTGNVYGYGEYYRWDDTKEVVRSKSVVALKKRGVLPKVLKVSSQIIKY
jgi:HEPN domain-containing protein|tara:strand:- start:352 stop:549 length:198 start_codon:yes stop_codon:yes gene_type:complete